MRKRDQLDWRDAARERFAAAQKVPRCGDCRSLSAMGACRNLSSLHCLRDRVRDSAACPWWADADDNAPLPAVHQEWQTSDLNHPRGMPERARWTG